MHPEALILRRCYPVPVTFADLRAAAMTLHIPSVRLCRKHQLHSRGEIRAFWTAALKQITSAIDEVYAVVDGREVRVATVSSNHAFVVVGEADKFIRVCIDSLLTDADEQNYWERPHEVRLDLSPRPVTHDEVARAVLVGQEYAERHARG